MTTVQLIRGGYLYESGFAVDGDGSPRCYALDGSGMRGLDHIGNAGAHGNWWGVVCNASGLPVVQGPHDPAPGYCVSTTALVDSSRAAIDPRRYVNSETVPYASMPRDLTGQRGVRMGDVAVAVYKGVAVGCIVADVSPAGHYGEGSIALAQALGLPADPRSGGVAMGVTWLVFPRSHATPAWPRTLESVQTQAVAMLQQWGGIAAVPWLAPAV